jgi:hypothetical protein
VTPTRQELEREVLSLRDRLDVAMAASVCARNVLAGWVSADLKKGSEFKRLMAFVSAVAKESPMATPHFARIGWQQGMKEAKDILGELSKEGTDEWRAASTRAIEEIEKKLKN